ncbi:807_t:CDS:2 [Racocetra fulgida]|uniref:807_t:CDS:1 n=1 Tax=Racocetra fulgida TaxID=60492 RepID=A0A9N8VE66_9GLOM|nr:807_t:CDS:2 [Racocetra fulgida]
MATKYKAGCAFCPPCSEFAIVGENDRAVAIICNTAKKGIVPLMQDFINKLKKNPQVIGFFINSNAGSSAEQTVFHTHIHIVPDMMAHINACLGKTLKKNGEGVIESFNLVARIGDGELGSGEHFWIIPKPSKEENAEEPNIPKKDKTTEEPINNDENREPNRNDDNNGNPEPGKDKNEPPTNNQDSPISDDRAKKTILVASVPELQDLKNYLKSQGLKSISAAELGIDNNEKKQTDKAKNPPLLIVFYLMVETAGKESKEKTIQNKEILKKELTEKAKIIIKPSLKDDFLLINEPDLEGTLDLGEGYFRLKIYISIGLNEYTKIIKCQNAQEFINQKCPTKEERGERKKLEHDRESLDGDCDLSDFINLERANFSSSRFISISFLNTLPHPEKLITLIIYCNNIQPTDIAFFSKFVNLETLQIGALSSSLSETNYFYGSLKSLKNLTKLKQICIAGTDVEEGLEYLPDSLAQSIKKKNCRPHRSDAKVAKIQNELRPFDYDLEA